MDNFFPTENYTVPITSNYMKLPEGSHKFRVLSSAVVGYEYFTNENKPVRSKTMFEDTPLDIKSGGRINHFWAFVVWSYEAERVQILEISQKSIQTQMKNYIDNPDWGNPREYDFTIIRKGTSKNDTEYTVMASPHKPTSSEIMAKYQKMSINLEALFADEGRGTDPFATKEK